MSEITKHKYEGHPITFEFSDGNKMINATEMIKAFPKKKMNNFLRTAQTKDYISMLESRYAEKRFEEKREVLRVVKGGSPELQGTWMDEKLALKFAAWLSPKFELWVYDKIEELLRTGKTGLDKPMTLAEMFQLQAELWMQQEEVNKKIKEHLEKTDERLTTLEAKITSIDENYYTVAGYCSMNGIACPLGKARSWGYAATKLSNQKGVPIGKAHDEKYGQVNTYHNDILKIVVVP